MKHLKSSFVRFPVLKVAPPDAFEFGSQPTPIDGGVLALPMSGGPDARRPPDFAAADRSCE
jgi:hypothetical protein